MRNLIDHAMARHLAPACWPITALMAKILRGKPVEKRTKATLADPEMRYLIEGVERRNSGWADVHKPRLPVRKPLATNKK
jgi:hypothetical protein